MQGTLDQVAARCAADPQCAAIIFKPSGLGDAAINGSLGLLRRASGANVTLMVANPSTLVYMKEDAPSSGGSSGLPAGAIAGIAAGCAVLAVAAAAVGWVVLRRRRQRRMQHSEPAKAAEEAAGQGQGLGMPPPAPVSGPVSDSAAGSPPPLLSVHVPAAANGASFGAAQQSTSSLPTQDVAYFKLRPVAAASPFASMRQSRVTASTGTAGSACTPRSLAPTTGVPDPELHLMMSELMQFRAREDTATGLSSPSSLGRAQAALGSPAGSGGGPSSGDCNTGGTSLSAGSGPLPSGRLPSNLEAWLFPVAAIEFDTGPTGKPVVMGEGARCGLAGICALGLNMHAPSVCLPAPHAY